MAQLLLNDKIEFEAYEHDTIKLYTVPTNYSEDGLFLAVYNEKEDIEPYPACSGNDSELVLHAKMFSEQDIQIIQSKDYILAIK